jgi:hypothetical protein
MDLRRELVDLVLGQFDGLPCPVEYPSKTLLAGAAHSPSVPTTFWENGLSPACPVTVGGGKNRVNAIYIYFYIYIYIYIAFPIPATFVGHNSLNKF